MSGKSSAHERVYIDNIYINYPFRISINSKIGMPFSEIIFYYSKTYLCLELPQIAPIAFITFITPYMGGVDNFSYTTGLEQMSLRNG